MRKSVRYGRITTCYTLCDGGICAFLEEPRGNHVVSWEVVVKNPNDLDFEEERDSLTREERAFLLGAYAISLEDQR